MLATYILTMLMICYTRTQGFVGFGCYHTLHVISGKDLG